MSYFVTMTTARTEVPVLSTRNIEAFEGGI